ncbi:hypothetical protein A3D00_01080 [Candidatus Woesebacteria bacterium RIFCSPHIGHO2_02_FULL_38_9]|uniref:Uncharacterized protein n=1 Tax=Candidatus Woesebacteria bacterium RIFCSPHIGHO2_01_FULL_39_28 TaxID=1802496 RepID=A0A1F7YH17_9BACT|nr:MAG: hypothetical protein A2627_01315 [Candidatus Woesebacteria bacterium RIFCSPHIGHO2_01_FULL_39_28]OGM31716.1 MAG: hypothetical protein A3D00_01080 [Candidatus Woesebacteria bacterium RIFCSPHIGHO2_02_FULL_38_9]OGM57657.1 MAG: hypothetical protein A3A50_01455 [Candidatus Woesebacteria bacterium RIFCSPLOWO2_01_FULL_38_20]
MIKSKIHLFPFNINNLLFWRRLWFLFNILGLLHQNLDAPNNKANKEFSVNMVNLIHNPRILQGFISSCQDQNGQLQYKYNLIKKWLELWFWKVLKKSVKK